MMEICMENRSNKRKRDVFEGDDAGFAPQYKFFINQRIINSKDEQKMVKIHEKTLQLLFDGAKAMNDKFLSYNKILRLFGNGQIKIINGWTEDKIPSETDNMCRGCNDYSRISGSCSNCPSDLCELCGISCNFCDEFLCITCFQFFNCNINNETPCCEKCKAFAT